MADGWVFETVEVHIQKQNQEVSVFFWDMASDVVPLEMCMSCCHCCFAVPAALYCSVWWR